MVIRKVENFDELAGYSPSVYYWIGSMGSEEEGERVFILAKIWEIDDNLQPKRITKWFEVHPHEIDENACNHIGKKEFQGETIGEKIEKIEGEGEVIGILFWRFQFRNIAGQEEESESDFEFIYTDEKELPKELRICLKTAESYFDKAINEILIAS